MRNYENKNAIEKNREDNILQKKMNVGNDERFTKNAMM